MITSDEFFQAPRSWSVLKYKILTCYLSQYFPKINQATRMGAIAADLFAGRGRFDNGDAGSPMIIAKEARRYTELLGYRNLVVLAESDAANRNYLEKNLSEYVDDKTVVIIPGEATNAGTLILDRIKPGVPLFVFLDPFGIKGLTLDLLQQLFRRAKDDSTEVLVNFNHRALHRLAGLSGSASSENPATRRSAESALKMANDVLGGDWWIQIMSDGGLQEDTRAKVVLDKYVDLYRPFFKWAISIPVYESFVTPSVIKYYLIFASRSAVALEIMNDCVHKAKKEMMELELRESLNGTLFEGAPLVQFIPKRLLPNQMELVTILKREMEIHTRERKEYTPGSVMVRRPSIRARVMPELFSLFSCSDYNRAIAKLIVDGVWQTENGRNRISDDVFFSINETQVKKQD